MKRPRWYRSKAFTLVEVLVVMAIMMVLLAIVMPVYRSSVSRAKVGQCQVNLKRLATALEMYTNDEGGFPTTYQVSDGSQFRWDVLMPYVGTPVILCFRASEMRKPDYFAQYPVAGPMGREKPFSSFQECLAKRGPEFPVFYDSNHFGSVPTVRHGEDMMLFARLDTSVHLLSGARMRDLYRSYFGRRPESKFPCPDAPLESNL